MSGHVPLYLISDDVFLGKTREAVLSRFGFPVRRLQSVACDGLVPAPPAAIVCQSIPRSFALHLAYRWRAHGTRVIRIGCLGEQPDPLFCSFLHCPVSPEQLEQVAAQAYARASRRSILAFFHGAA